MMFYRRGKEFSEKTKQFVLRRSGGKCELTGQPLGKEFDFHHRLSLIEASRSYPHIDPNILKSPLNCQVVRRDVHQQFRELHTDRELLDNVASELLQLQRRLLP